MTQEDRLDELTSRSLTTRGFQTDTIIFGMDADNKELVRMERRAILDAVAQQILHRKSKLAAILGRDLDYQAIEIYLEELEACEPLMERAERLNSRRAYNAFMRFIDRQLDQFEYFLTYNSMDSARNISRIGQRSPYPEPEEQRNWLQKLFNGQ